MVQIKQIKKKELKLQKCELELIELREAVFDNYRRLYNKQKQLEQENIEVKKQFDVTIKNINKERDDVRHEIKKIRNLIDIMLIEDIDPVHALLSQNTKTVVNNGIPDEDDDDTDDYDTDEDEDEDDE